MDGLVDDEDIVFTGFSFNNVDYGSWLCTFHLTVSDADQVFCPQAVVNSHNPKQIVPGPGLQQPGDSLVAFNKCNAPSDKIMSRPLETLSRRHIPL